VKKLLVILADPLEAFYEKGEIKPRYYNPGNLFGEVHFISFSDRDIREEKVQLIVGEGRMKIHCVGKFSLTKLSWLMQRISRIVEEVEPHILRAFDPFWPGYIAVRLGTQFGIPSVLSIHCDLDPFHHIKINGASDFRNFLKMGAYKSVFLSSTLRDASWVICAYEFAYQGVRRYRRTHYEVIYNKVYTQQYTSPRTRMRHGRVLSVGRHIRGKDPENLIRALVGFDGVELVLIGKGPLTGRLKALVQQLRLEGRVSFVPSVPNTQIHTYYLSGDVFALPILYGGVCIPVLEAMAAGLPVVLPKPLWEKVPEVIGSTAVLVNNTPEEFREAIKHLLNNDALREKLGAEGRKKIEEIDGHLMENREKTLYQSLCA